MNSTETIHLLGE